MNIFFLSRGYKIRLLAIFILFAVLPKTLFGFAGKDTQRGCGEKKIYESLSRIKEAISKGKDPYQIEALRNFEDLLNCYPFLKMAKFNDLLPILRILPRYFLKYDKSYLKKCGIDIPFIAGRIWSLVVMKKKYKDFRDKFYRKIPLWTKFRLLRRWSKDQMVNDMKLSSASLWNGIETIDDSEKAIDIMFSFPIIHWFAKRTMKKEIGGWRELIIYLDNLLESVSSKKSISSKESTLIIERISKKLEKVERSGYYKKNLLNKPIGRFWFLQKLLRLSYILAFLKEGIEHWEDMVNSLMLKTEFKEMKVPYKIGLQKILINIHLFSNSKNLPLGVRAVEDVVRKKFSHPQSFRKSREKDLSKNPILKAV